MSRVFSPARDVKAAKFSFFLAGFAMAAWAPLVPYLKVRLNITHLELSQIILLMGAGSIVGMLATSQLIKLLGVRKALFSSAVVLLLSIVFLVNADSYYMAAAAISAYGITIGCMEVGSNIYGTLLESEYKKVLMPSMHGFYSTGEIVSLSIIALLLHISFEIEWAIIAPVLVVFAVFVFLSPHLSGQKTYQKETFALPRGVVLILALLSSFILMVEGSMLDWSALLMMQKTDVSITLSSSAYIVLVIFLAVGRFSGGSMIDKFGIFKVLFAGLGVSILALAMIFMTENLYMLYIYFSILGLGMANVLPIVISLSGRQKKMSTVAAISSVSSCGYGALIIGPALIGFIAEHSSLNSAILFLSLLGLVVSAVSVKVVRTIA
ncbi:Inner membrane protein ybjJ [Anaerobiospirillum thomasii]|uniref:Inner membrane protein ybjJ n=1 Tax=Anaerobiospirillum thomasii TaxID=179995 RepID=A0A2X0V4U5_9GAMM|nr:MFS transporter [Anaerobiospirillum thomasii]SPT68076.1 Inner membrane protein ybjJ [Anaerobiospirillum thomasii]SPT70538.1 Inner membrane protein ybjJ [Anaerobiospirillum thomasii]